MEYGLLGEKLGHSYSPMIHSYFGSYEYILCEKAHGELKDFLTSGSFKGLNVTIPYKTAVMEYMDELSPIAREIGSVNTVIRREDGTLFGDNTDFGGLIYTVNRSKIKIKGKKALVLGSGGASLTAQAVLRHMGASSVTVISRKGEDNYENISKHSDAEIIINTTPVGMYPNNGSSPVDLSLFPSLSGVVDIVANPARTALLLQAEKLGIPRAAGLPMLVAQAAYASQLFTGKEINDIEIEKTYKAVSRQTKNLILIGMPGCGKTTIGRRIAKILNREFIDLDAEIVKKAGKTIPEIFADEGEDAFRQIESECAAEACKKSGVVISTGGGIVTRERNRDLLRQNGTIVFVNRPTSQLATRGRPISAARPLEDIAAERMPIYKSWASVTVENMGVSPTAGLIISFLHLKKKKSLNFGVKTMRKNFGAKAILYPMPVLIIGSYGENGAPNAMNAAWGGISEEAQISICVSDDHKTTENILARGAFTVSIADKENVVAADYVGIVSGNDEKDKIRKAGWTAVKSEFVDAPLFEQLPLALECKLIRYEEDDCRLVGEIVNVCADERILGDDGKIDLQKFSPITYDPVHHTYRVLGDVVGKAFSDGRKLK